jgi:hypothetical protein
LLLLQLILSTFQPSNLSTAVFRVSDLAANSYKSDLLKIVLMSKMQQGWLHPLTRPMLGSGGCGGYQPKNQGQGTIRAALGFFLAPSAKSSTYG